MWGLKALCMPRWEGAAFKIDQSTLKAGMTMPLLLLRVPIACDYHSNQLGAVVHDRHCKECTR